MTTTLNNQLIEDLGIRVLNDDEFEADPGFFTQGTLSKDDKGWTFRSRGTFASLTPELSKSIATFVGVFPPSLVKRVSDKLVVAKLQVYAKGCGDYNNFLIPVKITAAAWDGMVSRFDNNPVFQVSGEVEINTFTTKKGEEVSEPIIKFPDLQFAGNKLKKGGNSSAQPGKAKSASPSAAAADLSDDEDIPF